MKIDKKAMVMALGLVAMSWAALLPLYLILQKKRAEKKVVEIEEKMKRTALGPVYKEEEYEKWNTKNQTKENIT